MSKDQRRVLIVEDDRPLAKALSLKLESAGIGVRWAASGQECLQFLADGDYDIILLDLMMPGFDGFQVLQSMQTLENAPTVFVVSNLSQQDDIKRAMDLGAAKYFVKADMPLQKIVDEVKKVLKIE